MKEYKIYKKSKNQYRININKNNEILQKYNIIHNEKIYYNIYIDKNLNKHLLISRNKVNKNNVIYNYSSKIYKNSVNSTARTFSLKGLIIDIFKLELYDSVILKDINSAAFLFEFVFK